MARLDARSKVTTRPGSGPPEPGILHLGLGSFHRAHQAVYTAKAVDAAGGDWGIVGAANANPAVVEQLVRQDRRYAVLELGDAAPRASVVAIHRDVLVARDDPEALVAWIADPRIRIVTLTVTERGHTFDPATRRLDLTHPDVASDLAGGVPRSPIGLLVAGLRLRHARGGEPIALVDCDNLARNGELLRTLVLEMADRASAPPPAAMRDWVADRVAFPSTMVDRIVPRTTDVHRDLVKRLLGVRDEAVVPAEPYSMWVVQDRFPGGRPAWEHAGVLLRDDVEAFERLKLGLLNATHSLVAYLGLLAGLDTIAEAVADPAIREAAEHLMRVDIAPGLEPPEGVDARAYGDEVLRRFANPHTGHRTSQVGSDGATKLPQRVGGPCRAALSRGDAPAGIALLLAAYLAVMAAGDPPANDHARVSDPERAAIRTSQAAGERMRAIADAVLERTGILPPDVKRREEMLDLIATLWETLARDGVPAAVRATLAVGLDRVPGSRRRPEGD